MWSLIIKFDKQSDPTKYKDISIMRAVNSAGQFHFNVYWWSK